MTEMREKYNTLEPVVRREVEKKMINTAIAPTIEETRDMFSRAAELDAADWLAREHPNMAIAVSQWIRNHGYSIKQVEEEFDAIYQSVSSPALKVRILNAARWEKRVKDGG